MDAKSSRQFFQNERISSDLEQILQVIESDLTVQWPPCLMPPMPLETLKIAPENWWQTQSCSGNFHTIQYYYVVEKLGEDLCASIANAKGQVADYYRISLLGVDNRSGIKILVQSTQVIPIAALQKCTDHSHVVKKGRQSWRMV